MPHDWFWTRMMSRRAPDRALCQTILLATALCTLAGPALADHPTPLPDSYVTFHQGYFVFYTNDNYYVGSDPQPGDDLNFFPTPLAQAAGNALDNASSYVNGNPNGYHAGYSTLGFNMSNPLFLFTSIYACNEHGDGCDNGSASPTIGIHLPADRYIDKTPMRIRSVMGHELFHHVEYEALFDQTTVSP